jgi:hypothetical protein
MDSLGTLSTLLFTPTSETREHKSQAVYGRIASVTEPRMISEVEIAARFSEI